MLIDNLQSLSTTREHVWHIMQVDWVSLLGTAGQALLNLGIFGIGAGVIAYVGRQWIDSYFSQKSTEYENELEKELQQHKSELDKELQNYENKLDIKLQDHRNELEKEQIIFSELHAKQGEVVTEIYSRLFDMERDLRSLAKPLQKSNEPSQDEKIDKVLQSGRRFEQYYKKHKIYLPPEICRSIEDLLEESRDIHRDFSVFSVHEPQKSGLDTQEALEVLTENWDRVNEDTIPDMKEQLESHFRELLGVELTNSQ